MNHELAVRIASTEVQSLSWREAENVIRTYLTYLAVCPMCDGTGAHAALTCDRCRGTGRDDKNVTWACADPSGESGWCVCPSSVGARCEPSIRVPQEGLLPSGAPMAEYVDLELSPDI